ncbi:MAG: helix-hairpin-helix domain-containing protein [Sphingobacteriales bacterium]|jgi:hypothetical protein|nr:helix-hairpin-helix domain-containing protein [Sphingobacteriales bacterium]MBP9142743.1 helix-hairpin-helix domain-containing protein [Chitinophagales bacterium]MDA0199767.1 helix-hairpin-helix domain-containing protein [Bacteroidota bacterium]MBK6889577.1 helix-hairpin-helix domain-containing protein [Sphingobacteriales bacterium]MBK7527917.1 helix-hairpin-helix domain-containing protein [Sphingobacteriales bacterium]
MKKSLILNAILFVVVAFLVASATQLTWAQPPNNTATENPDDVLEEPIEDAVEVDEEEGGAAESEIERLAEYTADPLNINTASYDELLDLGLLSPQQIAAIIAYRKEMNGFTHLYELVLVDGINANIAQKLLPFINIANTTTQKIPFKRLAFSRKHQVLMRWQRTLEQQAGYQPDTTGNKKFEGNPDKIYLRYRYNYASRVSYGITAEKDPGEALFSGSQKNGFDFYSAHIYVAKLGKLRHLALGDYEIKLGQGLICWSGFSLKKSVTNLNFAKTVAPVRPFTATNENNFFRGAAASARFGNWQTTGFASYHYIDANITDINGQNIEELEEDGTLPDDISPSDITGISALQTSGYHRTKSEITDKHAISRFDAGGNISYRRNLLQVGFNTIYTKLSASLTSSQQHQPENLYRFSGNELFNSSVDYRFLFKDAVFFGETAISKNGGVSTLNGVTLELSKYLKVAFMHRFYSAKYQTLNASAFGENSQPNNETGLFTGVQVVPFPKWTLTAYVDMYQHPWLRASANAPSNGVDIKAQANYKPSRYIEMYWRFQNETKLNNIDIDEEAEEETPETDIVSNYLVPEKTGRVRYNLQYSPRSILLLKARAEVSWFKNGDQTIQNGYFLSHDFKYTLPKNLKMIVYGRVALFDAKAFDTRFYTYESDVLYSFSVPALSGQGLRWYGMVKFEPHRKIAFWLRFAQTRFTDRQTISAGDTEIKGRIKSEAKLMLRYKL